MAPAKQKAAPRQIITANRLSDGLVVFLAAGQRWSEAVAEADVLTTPEAVEAALAFGKACQAGRLLVDPVAIDVIETATGPWPVRLRERIRAFGPTARTDIENAAPQRADAPAA